jgi:hypothetical protein
MRARSIGFLLLAVVAGCSSGDNGMVDAAADLVPPPPDLTLCPRSGSRCGPAAASCCVAADCAQMCFCFGGDDTWRCCGNMQLGCGFLQGTHEGDFCCGPHPTMSGAPPITCELECGTANARRCTCDDTATVHCQAMPCATDGGAHD